MCINVVVCNITNDVTSIITPCSHGSDPLHEAKYIFNFVLFFIFVNLTLDFWQFYGQVFKAFVDSSGTHST